MEAMYSLMPGLRVLVEDSIAEGDKVMCRNVWRWTDAQTGKPMEFHGFVLWRLEGGKIAERWDGDAPGGRFGLNAGALIFWNFFAACF